MKNLYVHIPVVGRDPRDVLEDFKRTKAIAEARLNEKFDICNDYRLIETQEMRTTDVARHVSELTIADQVAGLSSECFSKDEKDLDTMIRHVIKEKNIPIIGVDMFL